MAESITEGTLKQWLKQKGDYVEADEEVATIETDKVCSASKDSQGVFRRDLLHSPRTAPHDPTSTAADCLHALRLYPSRQRRHTQIDVAVNAPKAGVLTELLANEEDTVAVGQDLFKLDPNGKAEGGGACTP